ncbi:hypothetical protein K493DRAFT_407713 [Basidiobolus meristosporus CBS 931.73]|uniref:SEC7 domain-containing protein n=1 Tax=Basidiobolus meristosporus CBS 931.73 TaxID=1314790 RepID=A0A1Y1YAY1_9FUNG|nr:hypothetical protein K493DRAFT_407713 [Basidiobolus meristosporus CBS 931.73]|eukprot:ORX95160.1 hypothetical protein K493DRAFT_407713 [Basidiobolus meristosporus CBS 931.73]
MSENHTGPPSPTASTVTEGSSSTATSKSHLAAGALFIINALESIQKSKQGRKNKELSEAVTRALDVIKSYPDATVCTASDSVALFLPLKLACQTGVVNLIVTAIDCIGNLITYNYIFNGETIPTIVLTAPEPSAADTNPDKPEEKDKVSLEEPGVELSPGARVPLTDQLIDLVCDCFTGEGTNDKIQLQIIKALLAAITSETFKIHQRALLKAVRTTYNIFLLSRDPVNQTIAQGTLTQMVHAIFGRIKIGRSAIANGGDSATTTAHSPKILRNDSSQDVKEIILKQEAGDLSLPDSTPEGDTDVRSDPDDEKMHDNEEKDDEAEVADESASPTEDTTAQTSQEQEQVQIETISNEPESFDDDDGLVEVPLDTSAETPTDTSDAKTAESQAPTELNSTPAVEEPQESIATGEHSPTENLPTESDSISSAFKDNDLTKSPSVTQDELPKEHTGAGSQESDSNDMEVRDAYLLFRALCRLSMKPITTEGASDVKSLSMRSKLLSLHLILTIITSHLETFASPKVGFVTYAEDNQPVHVTLLTSVKQYLCLSLSRNLVLTEGGIFEVSLEIFLKLLQGLRMLLKKEIEVFFKEIFLPILEMRSASFHQKLVLLGVLENICNDPQALVEIYLNYDCDKEALDNIYERLVNVLSKITSIHTDSTASGSSHLPNSPLHSSVVQPSLTTTSLNNTLASQQQLQNQGNENDIRQKALKCLVAVLRSLTTWSDKGLMIADAENPVYDDEKMDRSGLRKSEDGYDSNVSTIVNGYSSPSPILNGSGQSVRSLPLDDPSQFESLKHRKQILQQGIQMFNWRPKKGLKFLLDAHCIENSEPKTIARFLLKSEGVNKTTLGEFLGEGNEESIAIMHAFVDVMNFSKMHFVDALRKFLQAFRLPGEAQKIDRFMLKFAERYVIGNAGVFANADTAYVLAYSVIMLNTDLHNPQVKNRMTKAEFLKNNAGIDDKADLPAEFLEEIYDDISKNEIRIKDEKGAAANSASNGPMSIFRDLSPFEVITGKARREFNAHASAELASKTEAIFKGRGRRGISRLQATYYSASHFEHVRPMFELVWMAFLAGVSTPMQDYDDLEVVNLSLEGLKFAVHIAAAFDMELERNAFVSTLAKFTYLNNLSEMKVKNVEAIKTLLEIAHSEGNYLKESWRDVLACVSQLERFQLISNGADGDAIPDLTKARRLSHSPGHLEKRQSTASLHSNKSGRGAAPLPSYAEEAAIETRSQQVVVAVDRIFTGSVRLSGHAVVDFVKALSEISMEEIHSSKNAEHPRTYCLQKLVEICYYNMSRIRMEWSNMWDILGDHFNQVGCHANAHVGFFALDSLRQLSMKFLEKEELPHFKFQKDFLKPFEFILEHNQNHSIKDMILRCLQQMIQARGYHIRSGWKTMFGVFSKAAKEDNEAIVAMAFEIVKSISKENFHEIAAHGYLDDFVSCLMEFCKNTRFVKISLHSMEIYKQVTQDLITRQIGIPMHNESPTPQEDSELSVWLPIMHGLYDIIMNCDDLEVRDRALDFMFDTFKQHGANFSCDFWASMFQQIVFPMFHDLDSSSKKSRFRSQEDLSVWISTTLVQALRNTIDLFTFYFDSLNAMMDGVLELLTVCITHENETLGRIGNSCLQRLIESNVARLNGALWDKICSTFVTLFDKSNPQGLFDFRKTLLHTDSPSSPSLAAALPMRSNPAPTPAASYYQMDQHKQEFRRITAKCVLRLLLVQTVEDLFSSNDVVYRSIDSHHLFIIIDCLERSFSFAKRFNSDMELRKAIYEADLMPQLPNLFRQETQSAHTCILLLFKMYSDSAQDRQNHTDEVEDKLTPLSYTILSSYNMIDRSSVDSNLEIWRPVVVKVLTRFSELDESRFTKHAPQLYPQILALFSSKLHTDIRQAVQSFLRRLGDAYKIVS